MSCGGSAARNRNAAAIRDALASHPGALTVEQARAVFHRLSDARRAGLAADHRTADGSVPDRVQARELTQEAHAYARSRLDSEVAAVARAHAANDPNTRVLAADAAEWAANDPDTAAMLTPAQAAAEVRRERRAAVADAFASRQADGEVEERAAAATDDGPVDPGWGDASRWLARAADRRAARCQDPDEKARWTALSGRLERVARLQQAFGNAEVHAPENWETVVDHDRPYGPGLQARWDALSDTERDVMRLRKGKPLTTGEAPRPHTLDQAAAVLGVTAERIRQIESKARRKLQQAPHA